MKTLFYTIAVLCLVTGCRLSGNQIAPATDSEPERPEFLPASESTKYHGVVKEFMEDNLLNKRFNGAVLVAKNGNIVYEKYAGFTDLKKRDSISDHTSFHIASTSKTFTGMAVLQLVQENKIHLEDSLSVFFPRFPYPGVTVRSLLCHRSGIPNYVYFLENLGWDRNRKISNAEVLQFLYDKKPEKDFNPDTRFSYSNTNYVLLAMIIEKISGQSYPAYMKQKIFDPLQMQDTYVYTPADSATATPTFKNNGRYWYQDHLDNTYGDKNIYSTPLDLLKWAMAINNGIIISPALLESAYTPCSNERPSVHNYGLGWRMLNLKNGKKIIYHNGRWHGSNSAFAYLPDEKVTIIIVGNKYNSNIYKAARKAYDIFGNYMQTDKQNDDEEEDDEPLVKNSETGTQQPFYLSSVSSAISAKK